jgi:hypothetical protein
MSLRFYKQRLWQDLTYWTPAVKDKWSDDTFATPTSVKGLWFDRHEEFVDWRGDLAYSNATAYIDHELELMGWLYLGTTTSTNPKEVVGAFPIRRVDKLPGYRPGQMVYRARM